MIIENKGLCLKGDWWSNNGKLIECRVDYLQLQILTQECLDRRSHTGLYKEKLNKLKQEVIKALLWEIEK